MKSYEQIAAAMYHAYCKSLNLPDQRNTPQLSWGLLTEATQKAWIEAAKQAVAEMATVH